MSEPLSKKRSRSSRPKRRLEGDREANAIAVRLGLDLRTARIRRPLTQKSLAKRLGVDQSRISQLERGHGAGAPLGLWIAYGIAVGRALSIGLSRPIDPEPRDAGHLAAQELVLRLAAANGVHATFELPTRPANPTLSIDVGLRDDAHRALIVAEIWNRLEDLGAAVRSLHQKIAEAEGLAAAIGGDDGPYGVAACWILRATTANHTLLSRYPTIFDGAFPASSRSWAKALRDGGQPPANPGLLWIDLAGTRLYETRSSGNRTARHVPTVG